MENNFSSHWVWVFYYFDLSDNKGDRKGRIKPAALHFIPMYLLLTVNYLECGGFSPHLKNLLRLNLLSLSPPQF